MYVCVRQKNHIKGVVNVPLYVSLLCLVLVIEFFLRNVNSYIHFFFLYLNLILSKEDGPFVSRVFHLIVTSKRNLSTVSTTTCSLVSIGQTPVTVTFCLQLQRAWHAPDSAINVCLSLDFAIFPTFRLSIDAIVKSFKLARSLSNDTPYARRDYIVVGKKKV